MATSRFQRRNLLTGIGAAAFLGTGGLSAYSTKSSNATNTSAVNKAVTLPK